MAKGRLTRARTRQGKRPRKAKTTSNPAGRDGRNDEAPAGVALHYAAKQAERPSSPALELSGPAKLQGMIRERFPVETRAERLARSLAALHQEPTIKLSAEEWQRIIDDSDLES